MNKIVEKSVKEEIAETKTVNVNLLFTNVLGRISSVFFINITTVGLLGLIGYSLDIFFESKPMFLIIFIVLAFPVSIYLTIRKAKNIASNLSNN